jgi:hypothetical protein
MPADGGPAPGVALEGRAPSARGADVSANAATSAAPAARSGAAGSAALVLASFENMIIITSQPATTTTAKLKPAINANDTNDGRS